ncbi:hypothetical protein UCDDA912_g04629 [Diaporthe ampelina]|uniref:NTF2-like domain-containing protein n=1 Tax=Diaporthe ampelina TaxID=1214573 RepID=A0A0G2HK11_9PEZI|nr:hypothetical protein UCDDA912_g04629 [Diaporthe ampelina]
MRFTSVFLFVSTTFASSLGALEQNPKTVAALVDNYAQVVGNYSEALAQYFLYEDFEDFSDSINVLAGIPLGSVTFPSKQAFMASQATQPKIPVVVTGTYAVTRDTVAIRYTQTFGAGKVVAGIAILGFACGQDDREWKLKEINTEFNSLVYYQNIGGSCAGPS